MKLPNIIYIRIEKDGDESFPVAETDLNKHGGEVDKKRKVGVYELASTVTVVTKVTEVSS